jgi:hypothetical protein
MVLSNHTRRWCVVNNWLLSAANSTSRCISNAAASLRFHLDEFAFELCKIPYLRRQRTPFCTQGDHTIVFLNN